MLHVILGYDVEARIDAWTPAQDDAQMTRFGAVQSALTAQGRLGPAIRLGATADAKTWRPGGEPVLIDGPFAETKEQLLGLYVVECASADEAIGIARQLSHGAAIARFLPATLYCALCYSPEGMVTSLSKAQDDGLMARLEIAHKDLVAEGKRRERGRLIPTTAATTVLHGPSRSWCPRRRSRRSR